MPKNQSTKSVTSPFLRMQLGLGIKKVIEEKKENRKDQNLDNFYMDELLYKSFKRSRVRTSAIMSQLRNECNEARNGNFINMDLEFKENKEKPDREKQAVKSDRLALPKFMQTVQFFGMPKKSGNTAFPFSTSNQRVQSSQNLHCPELRGSRYLNELGSAGIFGSRNSAQKVNTAFTS